MFAYLYSIFEESVCPRFFAAVLVGQAVLLKPKFKIVVLRKSKVDTIHLSLEFFSFFGLSRFLRRPLVPSSWSIGACVLSRSLSQRGLLQSQQNIGTAAIATP